MPRLVIRPNCRMAVLTVKELIQNYVCVKIVNITTVIMYVAKQLRTYVHIHTYVDQYIRTYIRTYVQTSH